MKKFARILAVCVTAAFSGAAFAQTPTPPPAPAPADKPAPAPAPTNPDDKTMKDPAKDATKPGEEPKDGKKATGKDAKKKDKDAPK